MYGRRIVLPSLLKIILSVIDVEITQTIFNVVQIAKLLRVYVNIHAQNTFREAVESGKILLKENDPLSVLNKKLKQEIDRNPKIEDIIAHYTVPC